VLNEAPDVLTADQRDVLTEFSAINLQQSPAVLTFLARHLSENIGAARVLVPQAFGDVQVNAAILFLVGNRQCEDFTLGQF
jgi:hypothetical protein